jgi:hypothetical protein
VDGEKYSIRPANLDRVFARPKEMHDYFGIAQTMRDLVYEILVDDSAPAYRDDDEHGPTRLC